MTGFCGGTGGFGGAGTGVVAGTGEAWGACGGVGFGVGAKAVISFMARGPELAVGMEESGDLKSV